MNVLIDKSGFKLPEGKTKALGVVLFVVAGFILLTFFSENNEKVPCFNPLQPVLEEYHIHPMLKIIIDGEDVTIPANIGRKFLRCERVIHMHDETGKIHVELNEPASFTLGDFFAVWGESFSEKEFLGKPLGDGQSLSMKVNQEENSKFGELVLEDKQEIVLEYRSKP